MYCFVYCCLSFSPFSFGHCVVLTDYDYPFIIFKLFVHGRIISLRGDAWAHRTSLTPLPFVKVPVPSQESRRLCIYVVKVSILPLSTNLMLNFIIFQTPWSFFFFIFLFETANRFVAYIAFHITQNTLFFNIIYL